jgi:hypothetical protein
MAYTVFKHNQEYGPRKGLEGPFHYANGRVLYYDTKAGQYWDPRTDFYVEQEEMNLINSYMIEILSKRHQ